MENEKKHPFPSGKNEYSKDLSMKFRQPSFGDLLNKASDPNAVDTEADTKPLEEMDEKLLESLDGNEGDKPKDNLEKADPTAPQYRGTATAHRAAKYD